MIGLGTSVSLFDRGKRKGVASVCEEGEKEDSSGVRGIIS